MSTKDELLEVGYGDEQAAARVASKIDNVADTVVERLKFESAMAASQQRDKDLWGDSLFRQLFFDNDVQIRNQKPHLSYDARFQEAARITRAFINSRKAVVLGQTNTTNKATSTRSSAESESEASDGEPTPEEVSNTIQEMARSRGQNVASIHRWKAR
jgi:hypothetical protein